MSDPQRLLDGDVEVEKELLRAWSGRQPSETARMKTLAAVGAVGVGGALAAAGSGTAAAPKTAALSATALKWLASLGAVVATAGAVGYATRGPVESPPVATVAVPPVSAPAGAPVAAGKPAVLPAPMLPSPPPTSSAETVPALVASGFPSGVASAPPAPAAKAASTLDDEIAAIGRGRAALAAGDPTAALQVADAYDAHYPGGALSQESAEIRIEALFRLGRRPQADKLAARFLSAYPASPYAKTVRTLSGASSPGP